MPGPLDGIDLGSPATTTTTAGNPAPKKAASSGPLAGIDLSAPPAKPPVDAAQADLDKGESDTAGYALQRAMSTGTLGATDYLGAGVNAISRATGLDPNAPDLATIQRQNEEFGQAHPYIALGSDLAGYTLGAGKLGVGARVAERLGGGALARAAGYGLEQAGASAVSEEAGTQGQASVGDLLKHAALAGAVGAATGAIPGSKGAMADVPSPTSDLENTASQMYAPLKNKVYQTSDVEKAISNVNVPQGMQAKMSTSLSDQIDRVKGIVAKGGQTTADDIADFRASLMSAAKNPTDQTIAGQYVAALDKGVGSKTAGDITAANAASRTAKTSGDIDDWIDQARTNPSGTQADISNSLKQTPGFYPGTVGDMLKDAAQPPGMISRMAHAAAHPAADAALEGLTGYFLGGQDLPTAIASSAVTGLGGMAIRRGLSQKRTNDLVNQLAAARHFNNTGQTVAAPAFNKGAPGPLGPMAAYAPKMGMGVGASNLIFNNQN